MEAENNKFKKFWVYTINNYLCDADYIGKRLKEKYPFPSFRKFYFIRKPEDLKYLSKRDEISNEDLANNCLANLSKD